MKIVSIRQAKAQLSKLVEEASKGKFIRDYEGG